MKNIILISALIIAGRTCFAQIEVNDLNIPSSPAFVLMDKSPASIERPSNPKALAVNLINIWQNSGAIEFAPYWLTDHRAYTFDTNLKKSFPVVQTFAISGATAKEGDNTNISVGFRTQLIRLYSASQIAAIKAKKGEIVDLLSQENPEDIDLDAIENKNKEISDLQSRTSFNLEIAGAYMGQSGPTTKLASTKAGLWANVRFTPTKIPINLTALGRYTWATSEKSKIGADSAFIDFGANLSYQNTDFDLQFEYVNRRDLSIKTTYDRLAFIANYQIIPGIVAVVSFGKDFKQINNVFSALGVKFGLSKEKATLAPEP